MEKKAIGIIGFGNMGKAIAKGLLAKRVVHPDQIIVSDIVLPISDQGIICTTDNIALVAKADVILLAIKPQVMNTVLEDIKKHLQQEQLVISIAAGIPLKNFQQAFGEEQPIIRAMPNLNAMVSESMTAWVCSSTVSEEQKNRAKEIFRAIGKEVYLEDENMINAFTALAGSGPAYVFYLAEVMQKAAIGFGFSRDDAQVMVYQTLQGSVATLMQSTTTTEVLRQQVTSKGGTTEAAFTDFTKNNLEKIFIDGITKAKERGEELAVKE